MNSYDDDNHQWAKRFLSRDKRALEEAIDVFGPSVHSLVKRILAGVGSLEDAEECASDVFLTAWHSIERYEAARASFRTWLLLIAKYKSLDVRRKLLRRQDSALLNDAEEVRSERSAEQEALSRESTRELIAYVQRMGEPDRSLFWRRYFLYEGLDELASAFGLTKKAVENRLYRCRTALKQFLTLTETEREEEMK